MSTLFLITFNKHLYKCFYVHQNRFTKATVLKDFRIYLKHIKPVYKSNFLFIYTVRNTKESFYFGRTRRYQGH